ncbi:MAG: sulfatase-like hydrolase/transferase [Phycisphaerales bacterium]|nr:MAG: sulfatase-like hydrolase/transferase [Phycisphaerales bacterium]
MARTKSMLGLLPVSFIVGAGLLTLAGRLSETEISNVILISIDTCRADHLGCYGCSNGTTPHIDALAREGVVFSNAFTPAPMTLPAHSSMLTGMIPPFHGVHDNVNYRLGDSAVTLAELLRGSGFQTAAVIGAYVLGSHSGISQGFDTFDDRLVADGGSVGSYPERVADDVSRLANAWLAQQASSPFFLFVHYYDPHDPYTPPEPFASRFKDNPYAGEIAYTDQAIGQVLDKIKELGLYDSSLIIIVGDHGEGLGEHGEAKHGYYVYNSTTKIPMILRVPGYSSGRQVDQAASLTDIVPTVLAQLGAPVPPSIQGENLSPLLSGDGIEGEGRCVYSEATEAAKFGCSTLRSVQTGTWKYIHAPRPELYNLVTDPDELDNVVDVYSDRAGTLQTRLRQIMRQQSRPDRSDNVVAMDPDRLARLRSLGYTGGSYDEDFELDSEGQDPKDFAEVYAKLEILDDCVKYRDHAGARQAGEEILALRPDLVQVHHILGRVAIKEGDVEAAVRYYTEALRLDPESVRAVSWYYNLGMLMTRNGRLEKAAEYYRQAIRKARRDGGSSPDPNRSGQSAESLLFSLHDNLANILLHQGKFDEAVSEYRNALRIKPNDAQVHYELGIAWSRLGRASEATAAFRAVLRLAPNHTRARRALEAIARQQG